MGKIKMSGNATMEFEPDYYEFHITVSTVNETSGYAVSKGHRITESILRLLKDRLGIDNKTVILKDEKNKAMYEREDGYNFEKKFYFCYNADNRITEYITELLENMSDVEYEIKFRLDNEPEKEQQVLSEAVENSRKKAEKLATALGSHITGFEEINYRFNEKISDDVFLSDIFRCLNEDTPKTLASDMKNPKIKISRAVEIIWLTD